MNIRSAVLVGLTAFASAALRALPASAAKSTGGAGGGAGGGATSTSGTILDKGVQGLQILACRIFRWVYTFAIIVGVTFIVIAGIQYMTARGDSEKLKKAHQSLVNAMIGIAVAIIAWAVPNIIGVFLESGQDFDAACP